MFQLRLRLAVILVAITAVLAAYRTTAQPLIPQDPLIRAQLPYLETEASLANHRPDAAIPQARLSWSKVVYQTLRDGNWEIYRSDDDGTNAVRLTNHSATDMHPRLNRGGTRIVYASHSGGNYEIYVMNSDGSGQVALTNNDTDDVFPAWSPDGRKIAFQAYRDGQPEIYVMNADGSGQTRLTNHPAYDGYPAWSPDGRKIAFMSNRSGDFRIYVMNADGSGVIRLSNQPGGGFPAWSPDGSQIAYSADGDNNGWLEIWVMNADGSSQRRILDYYNANDAWVSGWSPDGRYVTYTNIAFIFYNGQWYWTAAYANAIEVDSQNTTALGNDDTTWNPHWQTLDNTKPVSSIAPLPDVSPYSIPVRWSGSDSGGAGLKSYDVQVMVGASGAWTDWLPDTTETSAAYEGVAGQTYAFRARARDKAHNVEAWPSGAEAVTTIETLPPQTAVFPLPPYTRHASGIIVQWGGIDPGGSGIKHYDVQYRVGAGAWQNWLTAVYETAGYFDQYLAPTGESVSFRSRAVDFAGNREAWPGGGGDASTTLYTWGVSGIGYDNTGAPISGIVAAIDPATFANVADTPAGNYAGYTLHDSSEYTVAWSRAGLGSLPPTRFAGSADAKKDIYLPPAVNLWVNGDFESGSITAQNGAPVITDANAHTGQYALLMSGGDFFDPLRQLSDATDCAEYPEAAFDQRGNLHVIWQAHSCAETGLFYTFRNPGGTWSSPLNIAPGLYGFNDAKLIVSGNVVHVAFSLYVNDSLYYTYCSAEGVWSAPHRVNGSEPARVYEFAVAGNGDVHFIWKHYHDWIMYYTRRAANGSWDAPYMLAPGPNTDGRIDFPDIVTDSNNNAHMVWYNNGMLYGQDVSIQFATRSAAGQWTRHNPVVSASYDAYSVLKLYADGANKLHLLWYDEVPEDDAPEGRFLYHASYSGGRWTSPFKLATSDFLYDDDVFLIGDGAGKLHLLLHSFSSSMPNRLLYRQRRANGTWDTAVTLYPASEDALITREPVLAVYGQNVFAGWTQCESAEACQIMVARKEGAAGWSTPVSAAPNLDKSYRPRLLTDASGVLHLVWPTGDVGYTEAHPQVYHTTQRLAAATEAIRYSQALLPPETLTNGVVSYLYQLTNGTADGRTGLFVDVSADGATTTIAAHTTDRGAWTHSWADLSPWAGEAITLTFRLQQQAGRLPAQAYLDDVSVGAAHPDVWVTADRTSALPNEQATHTLTYGNRGGAAAAQARLTYTLPPELAFVSASPPPVSTAPLVWELGDLPAKSAAQTLTVTVRVAPSAAPFSTLSSTAVIAIPGPELETLNNSAQGLTFVGRSIYLPLIVR